MLEHTVSFVHLLSMVHEVKGFLCYSLKQKSESGFPFMAEVTRMLSANTPRQFLFVIIATASTLENSQLIDL